MSRDFEVLNLGARGAGPLQSLAILREYGSLVRPRTVVWVYYEGNDPYDLRRETARDWLTSYLDERHTQNLSTVHEQIDGAYARWIDSLLVNRSADQPVTTDSGIDFPGILKLRSLRSLTGFNVPFPSEASDMGHLPQIFDDAAREVSDWGGRFYLAYLPSYERYAPHFRDGMPGKPQVLEAAQRAGITIIDLDVAFRAAGTPTAFWAHPRGHLNERGYRLVAREIADAIRSTPDRPPTP